MPPALATAAFSPHRRPRYPRPPPPVSTITPATTSVSCSSPYRRLLPLSQSQPPPPLTAALPSPSPPLAASPPSSGATCRRSHPRHRPQPSDVTACLHPRDRFRETLVSPPSSAMPTSPSPHRCSSLPLTSSSCLSSLVCSRLLDPPEPPIFTHATACERHSSLLPLPQRRPPPTLTAALPSPFPPLAAAPPSS